MCARAAQLVLGDFFVGHRLDDIRPGNEHVAGLIDHEDEIRDGRRVHRSAGTRAHDGGDLRNHSRSQRVAQKDIGITGQRAYALLDARATGIVQADEGRAHAHGGIHDLADFGGVGFRH